MKKRILFLLILAANSLFAQDSLIHDPGFGNAGYADISLTPLNTTPSWHPSNQNEYYQAALQRTDGKIALISNFSRYSSDSVILVVRLINSDGTTDAAFNGGLGYQSILLNCVLNDYTSAVITTDDAILFMPGQRVYRLDPANNYQLDANFNGGNGYFQFSSGPGTGIHQMHYFPTENMLTLSGKMGNTFIAETRVIHATSGAFAGQVDTQDWDFNPFNGNVNATDCLLNDTLMYQLGSALVNPGNPNYQFYVHLHSLSNLFDTLIPLPQVAESFANQKIHGSFLEDNSLLLSFFTFEYDGLPDQIRTIHLSAAGTFDTNYGIQFIDNVDGDTRDALFMQDYSNKIYLYTHTSGLRRVYNFDKATGYLDQSFCGDGIVSLSSTSGGPQSQAFAMTDQSILIINRAPFQGGVNPVNANSLMKYIDHDNASTEETQQSAFTIYPNPAKNKITLSIDRADAIIIRDINGKTIWQTPDYAGGEISLKNLASGIYLVEVVRNTKSSISRLAIE